MDATSLFRWESSSGLEHTCWQCHLKANNPKARQHCFGIHSIPCIRYHGTMFAIGQSHACAACIMADELHDQRHREIATLVNEYKTLLAAINKENTPTRRKKSVIQQPSQNTANIEINGRQEILRHGDDTETNSSTSTGNENHRETLSKAERRAYKKELKLEKAVKKSARNSGRYLLAVCQSDIDNVRKALHGDSTDVKAGGHPLATDKNIEQVIERNRRFVANIEQHKDYLRKTVRSAREATKKHRLSSKHGKPIDANDNAPSDVAGVKEVVKAVMLELGVNAANMNTDKSGSLVGSPSGSITAVVRKLREAIQEDLSKYENEQRCTCIRAGGFWRYCGRSVFDRMTEIAKTIDWRTGQVIKRFLPDEQDADVAGEAEDGPADEPEDDPEDEENTGEEG